MTEPSSIACACCAEAEPTPESAHRLLAIPAEGDIADSHVIRIKGTYYLYATHSQVDLEVWTSDDLEHWQHGGVVWTPTPGSWNAENVYGGVWAPAVRAALMR